MVPSLLGLACAALAAGVTAECVAGSAGVTGIGWWLRCDRSAGRGDRGGYCQVRIGRRAVAVAVAAVSAGAVAVVEAVGSWPTATATTGAWLIAAAALPGGTSVSACAADQLGNGVERCAAGPEDRLDLAGQPMVVHAGIQEELPHWVLWHS